MSWLRTTLFLAALTALLMWVGYFVGGQWGAITALVFAFFINFTAYWFSDRLVLSMAGAEAMTAEELPDLYDVMKILTLRAGMSMPRLYLIPEETPNAFATGRSPEHAAVVVTSGLLRALSRQELMGVLAHELSHVRHCDTLTSTIAATIAGAIGMLANMAQWALMLGRGEHRHEENQNTLALWCAVLLAPLTATLIQLAVSRTREYAADEAGAHLCGHPLWLASALGKLAVVNDQQPLLAAEAYPATAHLYIVNPLSSGTLGNLFSTHPPVEERIRRLEAMV